MRKYNRSQTFLLALVIFVVPLIIVYITGFSELLSYIQLLSLTDILLAVTVSNIPVLLNTYSWKKALNVIDIDMDFTEVLELNLSHLFVNNLTPIGYSGGEPTVAYFLSRRSEKSTGKILSAILAANTVNFVPIITMLAAGLIFSAPSQVAKLFFSFIGLKTKILEGFSEFSDGLNIIKKKWKSFFAPLLAVHLGILTTVFSFIIIGNGIDVALNPVPLLLIIPLSRFASYFPTPGGSGVYELSLIGLLMMFYNIGAEPAAAMTIIHRAMTFYFGLFTGYIAFSREGFRQFKV